MLFKTTALSLKDHWSGSTRVWFSEVGSRTSLVWSTLQRRHAALATSNVYLMDSLSNREDFAHRVGQDH